MTYSRALFSGIGLVFVFGGCKVFDESLIEEASGTDQELAVADHLSCSAPNNESLNAYRRVDTSLFDNSLAYLPNCLGAEAAPGNDTFFGVDMHAGEKWHFHVQVTSASVDPAIFVMDSCSDSRSCRDTYWGINACGEGENEHFSFVAPTTGRYFVGLDSLTSGGEPLEVFAVRAQCGNEEKEHSEFCDDGNDDPMDGCHKCRPVLIGNAVEVEPNDGPLDPNLIHLPQGIGQVRIEGTLGSRCDFDFFQLQLTQAAQVSAKLSGSGVCSRADLQIRGLDSPNPFQVNELAVPSTACPELEATEMAPGTYLVRVASRREPGLGTTAESYMLELDISPP